jgi:multicomponent Na+:H+ antiporter subunit G
MIVDALSTLLLLIGGFFVFLGGLGAVRLPDFYTRMHAASLTDSFGTILTLLGIMLQSGWSLATVKLLTILLFLMLTGPAASYALANAALRSDEVQPPDMQPAAQD